MAKTGKRKKEVPFEKTKVGDHFKWFRREYMVVRTPDGQKTALCLATNDKEYGESRFFDPSERVVII